MTNNELIGLVTANFLKTKLSHDSSGGTARYLLDCLTAEQTAAIAKAVLMDSTLAPLVDIKLPKSFVGYLGLPDDILTTERTTYFRSAHCCKPARLLANIGDDEEQSLKEVVPIGTEQLLNQPENWVDVASAGLPLIDEHKKWWTKALIGLLEARSFPITRFAEYVLQTQAAVLIQGHSIKAALGYALPGLQLPRDTAFFNAINDKTASYVSKWRSLYMHAIKKRGCYLTKQSPNQMLLTEELLTEAFSKASVDIPPTCHGAIKSFITAGSGWSTASQQMAEEEWESIKPLFDGLKREKFNLGTATIKFYDDRDPEALKAEEHAYLERLIERKTTESQEDDNNFYRDHRLELKEDSALKARWDRFVFGTPIESHDFIIGLAMCLEHLFDQDIQHSASTLTIRCDRRTKKDFRDLNEAAGLFFIKRYRGLKLLLSKNITWEVGELFRFDSLVKSWREEKKSAVNHSVSRSSLTLKFYFDLTVTLSNGDSASFTKPFTWVFNPNAITTEFVDDWERLTQHPLVRCSATRETSSSKGRYVPINLRDSSGLRPSFDKDRGSLVSTYAKDDDISLQFKANIIKAAANGSITQATARKLEEAFERFSSDYTEAIVEFSTIGLSSTKLLDQAGSWANLLELLCAEATGDRNREELLRPLLDIGVIQLHGGNISAIVAPWHPLRLAALASKARQVAELVNYLLVTADIVFGDPRLFFRELQAELDHPFYPEIVLGWREKYREVLSLSDHYLDYSLHESAIATDKGEDYTNDNPTVSSERVLDIVNRYLTLYPHERSNLSIVLYNCDSAQLPQAIVAKMGELQEDEEEVRCQVVLRHRDQKMLRYLYEKIIESEGDDADSFVASEATRDFMARLRIGIMVDQAAPVEQSDGPLTDIVFLHDVIARHARLEWFEESAKPVTLAELKPGLWSRRRPAAKDDLKSVSYLCCPVQSPEGWAYLTALATYYKGDWDRNINRRCLPARQLDFSNPDTASIFKEIHNLGNWVVNYDELLDRRQLINQDVQVIRYQQGATQGRSLLISSTAPLGLLKSMILDRIKSLTLGLTADEEHSLTAQLIDDANRISGDIVLRAAKRGRNASELIGVVLSRFLIKHELTGHHTGWFFLDDYANWLGQKEEQIADMLALSPEVLADGSLRLSVIITESKYIDFEGLSDKRKDSQKQLRDTIKRIDQALFGNPNRLDRDLWLSRFSDLLLQGVESTANAKLDLAHWRRAIRDGMCKIYLRGYSHVFISGPSDSAECSEFVKIANLDGAYQEVFSRAQLKLLMVAYKNQNNPSSIREKFNLPEPWPLPIFRQPAARISLHQVAIKEQQSVSQLPETNQFPIATEPVLKKELPIAEPVLNTAVTVSKVEPASKPSLTINEPWAYPGFQQLLLQHTCVTKEAELENLWLRQTENACKSALQQFQLQSKLVSSLLTPNAALLKFQGSSNLTVEPVLRRRTEFLTTHSLNIISVRAEPGIICIAIARPKRQILHLADVWCNWKPCCTDGNHELLVGIKEDNSEKLILSPKNNAPHTLIAGSTGSGKSVLMQNIVLGIAATNRATEARITIIDPKLGVDYYAFEGLPHLNGGIIETQPMAIKILTELVAEMNRRYTILRANKVSSVNELNKKVNSTTKLPTLWVIHDEFAEWMLTDDYKENVASIVSRLGVKARAAGIYLIFAAQRPDSTVLPLQLRANLGNRLILRVDSEGTSELSLGEKGAERLLNKGHMVAKLEGEADLIYAQVPYVSSEFLTIAVNLIKQAEKPIASQTKEEC